MHKQTLIKIKAAEKAALIIIMEAFRPLGRGLGGGHFLLCVCAANIQEVWCDKLNQLPVSPDINESTFTWICTVLEEAEFVTKLDSSDGREVKVAARGRKAAHKLSRNPPPSDLLHLSEGLQMPFNGWSLPFLYPKLLFCIPLPACG